MVKITCIAVVLALLCLAIVLSVAKAPVPALSVAVAFPGHGFWDSALLKALGVPLLIGSVLVWFYLNKGDEGYDD